MTRRNTEEDFWPIVERLGPDDCWEWKGSRHRQGYGIFPFGGKYKLAHILAYEFFYGPAPKDKPCICHRCDNPPCCNPSHLFAGSVLDNARDMIEKGRQGHASGPLHGSKTHPEAVRRGEHINTAKLTESDVLSIRARYRDGESARKLCAEFGISKTSIFQILRRKTWKHI
jgi:hypothetical protein